MAETNDAVLNIPADDIAVGGGAELEYAGFWSRVAALIVDNAILMIFALALLIAAGFVGAEAVVIANLVFLFIAILYWPLLESSERQATIGKQLLGIQVTDANGARLTFVRSLLRNLAKIISSLPFGLGYLLAAFTARKQALHDMITKCLVVRAGPSNLLKAVGAAVGALVISMGGGYYYFTEIYLPQMTQDMGQQMEKTMKEAQKGAPAAQPAPDKTAPGEPKLMTPQEIAEFEKKMERTAREPAKVAAATPAAPAPEQKPAAPASAKPAAVETKPAPVAKETAPKPAAAPTAATEKPKPEAKPTVVAAAKPEAKPAAVAAAKPKPAPPPVAEASTALVSEAPAPPPAPRAAEPKPAEPAAGVVAPAPTRVRSPRFNDVMTAVMYRDVAAATELLELGWWADRPDSNGVTPLMAAAWIGDPAMAQLLLKGGADPNRRGPGGSVLDYAGRSGDTLVIEMLKSSGAR